MWVIRAKWAGTNDHKWLVLVGGIWTQRLGRDRKTTLENWLGNGIWFLYPQCITISRHKMTLMCYVCVCVCVCLLLCVWMFLWEQGLCELRKPIVRLVIYLRVCVRCLSGIKLYREEILPPAGSHHSRGERHLNSFNTNCQHEKPNVQAKFFHVQYVSKFLTHKILVADMKCWGTDKAPLGKVFLSLLLLIRSEPHTGCFYISHHLMLWAGGKFLSITKLSSFFLSLSLKLRA